MAATDVSWDEKLALNLFKVNPSLIGKVDNARLSEFNDDGTRDYEVWKTIPRKE